MVTNMRPMSLKTVVHRDDLATKRPGGRSRLSFIRRMLLIHGHRRFVLIALVIVILVWQQFGTQYFLPGGKLGHDSKRPQALSNMTLIGFANSGDIQKYACDKLQDEGKLQILEVRDLEDDLMEIADALENHPMIDYSGQDPTLSKPELVNRTWVRLAQSSVWLEEQQVYFAVSRIEFYTKGVKHWPIISFLRGQMFDENWRELRDYTINWHGEKITFPKTFDIETPYEAGGCFYGPEDPRVVIEEGVKGAEPVIIFNMLSNLKLMTRTMHVFRPFSNAFATFVIRGRFDTPNTEKNWAPFFVQERTHGTEPLSQRPSNTIHFIYDFRPLQIIQCNLNNGWCKAVFTEKLTEPPRHDKHHGRMSGGTNFVPIPTTNNNFSYFVGFPRTHVRDGCRDDAMYRPELMIIATDGVHFFVQYSSGPIDFGGAAMLPSASTDPCGEGRILIANSVARWRWDSDVMELSYTVDDATTQVITITGVRDLVEKLPSSASTKPYWEPKWSFIGQDVLGCSVEAAEEGASELAAAVNGTDLRKERLEGKSE